MLLEKDYKDKHTYIVDQMVEIFLAGTMTVVSEISTALHHLIQNKIDM